MSGPQTPGRKANAAQPLGERRGLVSDKDAEKAGRQSASRQPSPGRASESPPKASRPPSSKA